MRAVTSSAFLALVLCLPITVFSVEPKSVAAAPEAGIDSQVDLSVDIDSPVDVVDVVDVDDGSKDTAFADIADDSTEHSGTRLSADDLDAQRGGADSVTNVIKIDGEVADNVAKNVTTGANSIQDGSFASSSGITTVVQNTGANVLIQSATIVNVKFAP